MFLLCALKQRAAPWTKDYFCCPILEQKKWWAERDMCLCMQFSHSMRGTFGKWLFLYRQRCLASPRGKGINSPFSASQAVLLQLCSPFCPCRPVRGTGEVIVCCCVPWHLCPSALCVNHEGSVASGLIILFLFSIVLPHGTSTGLYFQITLQKYSLHYFSPLISFYSFPTHSGFWCERSAGQDGWQEKHFYWDSVLDGSRSYCLWWESRCYIWLQSKSPVQRKNPKRRLAV